MKSLITALSVLTLATAVGNLGSNLHTHQQTNAVNTMLKQDMKEINNINLSNVFTEKNIATYGGGENYYNYYFAYHTIGLNHDTLKLVNNAIGSGIGAVAAILSFALPAMAPIVSVVAALLIAQ